MAYLKRQSINGEILEAAAADTSFVSTPVLVPHLQPGILYPAVANIMLDGATALSAATVGPNSSTVASSKYGTVQADGRMYYYTEIAGSKPIKDPRIGAYFGGQRHRMSSLQLLEQETAMTDAEALVQSEQYNADKQMEMQQLKLQIEAQKAIAIDDRDRDKMDQDLLIKAAEILGKYGTAVDTANIKKAQDEARYPDTPPSQAVSGGRF